MSRWKGRKPGMVWAAPDSQRGGDAKMARHKLTSENPPFGLRYTIFTHHERTHKDLRLSRKQFKKVPGGFLEYVADHYVKELFAVGIKQEEIEAMREGVMPVGFTVRHIKPITSKDSNHDYENLVLIPIQPFAAKINQYVRDQLEGINPGKSRQIKLPLLRSPVFPVPKRSVNAVTETRFRIAAEKEAEEQRRRDVRDAKQLEQQERAASRREQKRLAEEAERQREIAELAAWPPRGYTLADLRRIAEETGIDADSVEPVDVPGDHELDNRIELNRALIRQVIEEEPFYDRLERKRKNGKGSTKSHHHAGGKNKGRKADQGRATPSRGRLVFTSGPDAVVHGMPVVEMQYTRRTKVFKIIDGEKVDLLRYEGLLAKQRFLKMLAEEHGAELQRIYKLTNCEVEDMKEGFSPEGLSVHHKHPLGGAGDPLVAARANDFDNLILIPNDPYHSAIHQYLDPQIEDLRHGEKRTVYAPVPEGYFFVPPVPYERSGPPKYITNPKPGTDPENRQCPPPQNRVGGSP